MKMRRLVAAVIVLFALLPGSSLSAGPKDHPDKIIKQKTVTGRLVRLDQGDYVHVVVRSESGKEESFFLDSEVCFLAKHFDQPLTIRFLQVERYFPEGDGYYPANLMQVITVRGSKAKWTAQTSSKSAAEDTGRCLDNLSKGFAPRKRVRTP
jgi:hypothetical protein